MQEFATSEVEATHTARTKTREHKAAFALATAVDVRRHAARARRRRTRSRGGALALGDRRVAGRAAARADAAGVEPARGGRAREPADSIQDRVCPAMVGLPARGKSYISKAIIRTSTSSAARRSSSTPGTSGAPRGWRAPTPRFDVDASAKGREEMAMETLDELLAWLHGATTGCGCGIFDATNTTARPARRRERCARGRRT